MTVHSSASIEAPRSRPISVNAVETTSASSATIRLAAEASTRTQVLSELRAGGAAVCPAMVCPSAQAWRLSATSQVKASCLANAANRWK